MRTYKEYRVEWVIELSALSPREAAEEALRIQRDPDSTALVFDVSGTMSMDPAENGVRIDLAKTQ